VGNGVGVGVGVGVDTTDGVGVVEGVGVSEEVGVIIGVGVCVGVGVLVILHLKSYQGQFSGSGVFSGVEIGVRITSDRGVGVGDLIIFSGVGVGVAVVETTTLGVGVESTTGVGETAGDVAPKNTVTLIIIFVSQLNMAIEYHKIHNSST